MRTLRVLIAEDNDDHLFLARVALQATKGVDVQIIPASDGQEALDYLHGVGRHTGRELPHLILLDLSMPRRDGMSVLREMKSDQTLASLPVVVLTSSSRPEDINGAYKLGASSYVNKSRGLSTLTDFWALTAELPVLSEL